MTGPVRERRFAFTKPMAAPEPSDGTQLDLGHLMLAVRRQLRLVALSALVGSVVAVLMILGTAPRYNAVELVLLDEKRADLLDQVSPMPSAMSSDSAVQSEIEIIKSQEMAYTVVDRLNLDEDAGFLSPPVDTTDKVIGAVTSLADPLADLLTPAPPAPAPDPVEGSEVSPDSLLAVAPTPRDRAAALLRNRLSVNRVGRSFVIEIGFEDFDPARATRIARVYGSSYERFQLEANREIAGNAAEWLQERLDVLDRQSLEAASAVQQFRAENDLTQVRGNLLTEQQQSELATELVSAAANSAEKKAQLDSMESLLARADEGEDIVTVPGPQGDEQALTAELRREFQNVRLRHASLLDQFGPEHPQVLELQRRLDDLKDVLRSELSQATESARIAYAAARGREQSLRADLEAAISTSDEDVAVRGRLQQLEAISETFYDVYRQYLGRYQVAMQQQGFPIASVNVISRAEMPRDPSSPRKKAMLLAGAFLGAFIGIMIAAIRELLPKPVRTPSALRREVGVDCAGLLPAASGDDSDAELYTRTRTLARAAQSCEHFMDGAHGVVVGISPLTKDAPSGDALAVDLAEVLSRDDTRSVLVIADSSTADASALDLPQRGVTRVPRQAVFDHHSRTPHAPQGDDAILDGLRARYDFVLFEMPPLSRAEHIEPNGRTFDIAILRVPWGNVLPGFVSDALKAEPAFASRLATMVLEGADLRVSRSYMTPGSYEERETYA